MDIAVVNAFLFYKDITKGKGQVPMHQKAFRETLVEELAAAAGTPAPSILQALHITNLCISVDTALQVV